MTYIKKELMVKPSAQESVNQVIYALNLFWVCFFKHFMNSVYVIIFRYRVAMKTIRPITKSILIVVGRALLHLHSQAPFLLYPLKRTFVAPIFLCC
nr:MAG TPA: hypothetical protein [Caudoviricetes sp.]